MTNKKERSSNLSALQNQLKLNEKLENQKFIAQTITQITKDFGRCNLEIHFAGLIDQESLEDAILKEIQSLSSEKLQQLIYIIDIPESEFSKLLGMEFFFRALAEKILRREALKVFIRENIQLP